MRRSSRSMGSAMAERAQIACATGGSTNATGIEIAKNDIGTMPASRLRGGASSRRNPRRSPTAWTAVSDSPSMAMLAA